MRKSFELCCASAHSHSDTDEIPIARRCLDAMKADWQNPDLDELTEAIFQRHGIRLNKLEVARQLDAHRQGHSGTSAKAHELSSAASAASDRARNISEGDDPFELNTSAAEFHALAADAHRKSAEYHDRAEAYHTAKAEGQETAGEPADED